MEISKEGKKFSLLKSTLGVIHITYEDKVTIQAKENENRLKLSAKQFLSLE